MFSGCAVNVMLSFHELVTLLISCVVVFYCWAFTRKIWRLPPPTVDGKTKHEASKTAKKWAYLCI